MYGESSVCELESENAVNPNSLKVVVVVNEKGTIVDLKNRAPGKLKAYLLHKNVVDLLNEDCNTKWNLFHSNVVSQGMDTAGMPPDLQVKIVDSLLSRFLTKHSSYLPSGSSRNGFSGLTITSVTARITFMHASRASATVPNHDNKTPSMRKHEEIPFLSPASPGDHHSRPSTPSTSGLGITTPGLSDVLEDELMSSNSSTSGLKRSTPLHVVYLVEAMSNAEPSEKAVAVDSEPFISSVYSTCNTVAPSGSSAALPNKLSSSHPSAISRDGSKQVVEKLKNYMSQLNVDKATSQQSFVEEFTPSANQVVSDEANTKEMRTHQPTLTDLKLPKTLPTIKKEHVTEMESDPSNSKTTSKASDSQGKGNSTSTAPHSMQQFGMRLWRVLEYLYGRGIVVSPNRTNTQESASLQLSVPALIPLGAEKEFKGSFQQCIVCVTTIQGNGLPLRVENPPSNQMMVLSSRLLHYQIHSANENSTFLQNIQQIIDHSFNTFSWEQRVFEKDSEVWQTHLRKVLSITSKDVNQVGLSRASFSPQFECSPIYRIILKPAVQASHPLTDPTPSATEFLAYFIQTYSVRLFLPSPVIARISTETQYLFGQPPSCLLHYHLILQSCEPYSLACDSAVEAFQQRTYVKYEELSSLSDILAASDSPLSPSRGRPTRLETVQASSLPSASFSTDATRSEMNEHSMLEELLQDSAFPIICNVGKGLSVDNRRLIRDLYCDYEKNKAVTRPEESCKSEENQSVTSSNCDASVHSSEDNLVQSVHSILQSSLGPSFVCNTVEAYRLKQLHPATQVNDLPTQVGKPNEKNSTKEEGEDCLGGQTLSRLLSNQSDWISTNAPSSSMEIRSNISNKSCDDLDYTKPVHIVTVLGDSYQSCESTSVAPKKVSTPSTHLYSDEINENCPSTLGKQQTCKLPLPTRPASQSTTSNSTNSFQERKRPYSFTDTTSSKYEANTKRTCSALVAGDSTPHSSSASSSDTTPESLLHLLLTVPISSKSNGEQEAQKTSVASLNAFCAPTQSVDAFKEYLHKEADLYLQEEKRKQALMSSSNVNAQQVLDSDYDVKSFEVIFSNTQERSSDDSVNWSLSDPQSSMKQKERLLQRQKHQTFLRQMSVSTSETGTSSTQSSTSPTKYVLTPTCSTVSHPSPASVTVSTCQPSCMPKLEPLAICPPLSIIKSSHVTTTSSSILGHLSQSLREPAPNICVVVPSSASSSSSSYPFNESQVGSTNFPAMDSGSTSLDPYVYLSQPDVLDSSIDLNDTLEDLDLDSLLAPLEQPFTNISHESNNSLVTKMYSTQTSGFPTDPLAVPWRMPSSGVPPNRVVVTSTNRWSTLQGPASYAQSMSGVNNAGFKTAGSSTAILPVGNLPPANKTLTNIPQGVHQPSILISNNISTAHTMMASSSSAAAPCNNTCTLSGKGSSPSVLQELRQVLVQRYNHQQPMSHSSAPSLSSLSASSLNNATNHLLQEGNYQLMSLSSSAVSTPAASHYRATNSSLPGSQAMSSVAFLSPLTGGGGGNVNTANATSYSFRSCLDPTQTHAPQVTEFTNYQLRPSFTAAPLQQRVYIASPLTNMENVVLKPITATSADVVSRIVQLQPQRFGGPAAMNQCLQSSPITQQTLYPKTVLSMGQSGPGPPAATFRAPQPSPLLVSNTYVAPKSSPGSYTLSPSTGNSSFHPSYHPSAVEYPPAQQQSTASSCYRTSQPQPVNLLQQEVTLTPSVALQQMHSSQKVVSAVPLCEKAASEPMSNEDPHLLPDELTSFVLEYTDKFTSHSDLEQFQPSSSNKYATLKPDACPERPSPTTTLGHNKPPTTAQRSSTSTSNKPPTVASASSSKPLKDATAVIISALNSTEERRRGMDRNCFLEEISSCRESNGSILEDLLNS